MVEETGDNLFESIGLGKHISSLTEKKENFSLLVDFLRTGFLKGYKCYFISNKNRYLRLIERLEEKNYSIRKNFDTDQFEFLKEGEFYSYKGQTDTEEIFKKIKSLLTDAEANGYDGIWIAGQASENFSKYLDIDEIRAYESKVSEFVEGRNITILCIYNEDKFAPNILLNSVHTHPHVIISSSMYENEYYIPSNYLLSDEEISESGSYKQVKEDIFDSNNIDKTVKNRDEISENLNSIINTLEKLEKSKS